MEASSWILMITLKSTSWFNIEFKHCLKYFSWLKTSTLTETRIDLFGSNASETLFKLVFVCACFRILLIFTDFYKLSWYKIFICHSKIKSQIRSTSSTDKSEYNGKVKTLSEINFAKGVFPLYKFLVEAKSFVNG